MRFRGTYNHTVDSKGRVSLPAKFRKVLPENVVVVPGFRNALYVFTEEDFDMWVDSLFNRGDETFDPVSRQNVFMRKKINNSAEDVNVDAAGRIKMSASLREKAKIDKDVYIVGDQDHIEIWDCNTYDEEMSKFSLDDFLED